MNVDECFCWQMTLDFFFIHLKEQNANKSIVDLGTYWRLLKKSGYFEEI
jgi:hypothetical protein